METSSVWVIPLCEDWQKSGTDEVFSPNEALSGNLPVKGWPQILHLGYSVLFFFNWAIAISLKCSGTLSQVDFIRCKFWDVLPSRARLWPSPLFMSVSGLLCPHWLWAANKSSGSYEPQPSVMFMSSSLIEVWLIVHNEMTTGSRAAGWIMGT